MASDSAEGIHRHGAVSGAVVEDESGAGGFRLGVLGRAADAGGEVGGVEGGVGADLEEGAGARVGADGAVAGGGLGEVERVAGWLVRAGELEVGGRGGAGLGGRGVEGFVG